MELKEKILKILQEETYCDNSMGNFLKEEDFELIADKIVKLFAIPVVNNRTLENPKYDCDDCDNYPCVLQVCFGEQQKKLYNRCGDHSKRGTP